VPGIPQSGVSARAPPEGLQLFIVACCPPSVSLKDWWATSKAGRSCIPRRGPNGALR